MQSLNTESIMNYYMSITRQLKQNDIPVMLEEGKTLSNISYLQLRKEFLLPFNMNKIIKISISGDLELKEEEYELAGLRFYKKKHVFIAKKDGELFEIDVKFFSNINNNRYYTFEGNERLRYMRFLESVKKKQKIFRDRTYKNMQNVVNYGEIIKYIEREKISDKSN